MITTAIKERVHACKSKPIIPVFVTCSYRLEKAVSVIRQCELHIKYHFVRPLFFSSLQKPTLPPTPTLLCSLISLARTPISTMSNAEISDRDKQEARSLTPPEKQEKPWNCCTNPCRSGQEREKKGDFSRKAVSDFFGRNKVATRNIHEDVWHLQCRSEYSVSCISSITSWSC